MVIHCIHMYVRVDRYRLDGCNEMQSVDELQVLRPGATQQTVSGSDHTRGGQHRRRRRRELQFFTPHTYITRCHFLYSQQLTRKKTVYIIFHIGW